MTIKEFVWIAGILIAVGGTWGMTSQRIGAMEKDIDRMETAIKIPAIHTNSFIVIIVFLLFLYSLLH